MAVNSIEPDDGAVLVREARRIVTGLVCDGRRPAPDPTFESRFAHPSGIFVTITKQGGLRGCIGCLLPSHSLAGSLADAAVSAATEDPRFEPLTADELHDVRFEVTVLTSPEEITVDDPKQYPSHITVGRDGLIVRKGSHSGLLLPQVAVEYGWDARQLLHHTCEKAGLEGDAWMTGDTTILKFQGDVFSEP